MEIIEGNLGVVHIFCEHEPDFIHACIRHPTLQPQIWQLMHRWRDLPAQPELSASKIPEVCGIVDTAASFAT